MSSPVSEHIGSVGAARRAFTSGDTSLFVAPGRDGTTCLIVVEAEFTATCAPDITQGGDAVLLTSPHGRVIDVYAVVVDGFTGASVGGKPTAIVHNALLLEGAPLSRSLILFGPKGFRRIDMGPQIPPDE